MFLVTGATGGLGRRVVRLLREREQPVRALVRLNSHYSELEYRGAEIFVGNLTRDRDIEKATRGIRYVISAHGSPQDEAVNYRANIELIDRAIDRRVEHFVFISVLGADRGYEDAPTFKAKALVEKYLQASGLNYTILRPAGFASNLLPLAEQVRRTGLYLLLGDPHNRTSIVSTDDLAQMAVESVAVAAARNQTFAVGGPEILQRIDIPRTFGRIFNREPLVVNPPLFAFDGLRQVTGLVNSEVGQSLGTLRTLLANEFFCTPLEIDQLESVFSLKLETLETFLKRYLSV